MTQVKNTRETTISKEKEEEEGTSWTFAVELECASGAKSLQSHLVTFAHKCSSILKQFCGKCTLNSLMHWLKYWFIRGKRFCSYLVCVLYHSKNFLQIRCTPLVVKYKNESEFECVPPINKASDLLKAPPDQYATYNIFFSSHICICILSMHYIALSKACRLSYIRCIEFSGHFILIGRSMKIRGSLRCKHEIVFLTSCSSLEKDT